jgi:murein DD-endopeptidase MepM/ murein hydrolase activator NlpD
VQARPLLALSILVVAAACADAPPPSRGARGADVVLPAETETISARVPARATLDSLLRQHELQGELIQAAVEAARRVFDPRDLRADRPYRLVRSLDGLLREFEYEIDADRFLRIARRDGSEPEALDAQVLPFEKQTTVASIRGDISADSGSLIASMDAAGEQVQLAMALAEVFSGQIDFDNDLQAGDSYEVLFEKSTRDGSFAGYGEILGATFRVEGREYRAFRWADPATGRAGYYDENGRSLKRVLLRSPLRFEPRVTSRFSRRRLHPVHGVWRPHLGVDYAAPHGAAVVAVANGVVVAAGWSGGGGRMVRLRHGGGIETYYLHLSSFGRGIRRGARVEQGQVIGRVGSSGTATGPHLDYRMRRNGAFVNPVAVHRQQPPGEPIRSIHMAAFADLRDGVLGQLSSGALAGYPERKPDAINAAR